jgi:hypothetical protein
MLVAKTTCFAGLVLAVSLTLSVNPASAEGSRSKSKTVKAEVEGELIKKPEAKRAAGSDSKGTPLSLKVTRVIGEDGSELPDMKGKVLSFTKSKKRDQLLSQHVAGDKLTLMGKLDTEKATLELESFKRAGSATKK